MTEFDINDASTPPDADQLLLAFRAKERNQVLLLSRPNVIGLDVGHRVRDGQTTGESVVVVRVSRKLDREFLSENDILPDVVSIDGQEVAVDVVESEIPRPGIFTLRSRPLRGGNSVSPTAGRTGTGTAGVCVTLDDGNTYILSCNHVLANTDALPIGANIMQPGRLDGGIATGATNDIVATLFRTVPIDFNTTTVTVGGNPVTVPNPNSVDVALARVNQAYNVGNREVHWIGYPLNSIPGAWPPIFRILLLGRRVCKMGRTTEFTTGTIVSPFADILVGPYSGGGGGRTALFRNQIEVVGDGGQPFALPGDSGSLLVTFVDGERPTGLPLGVVFASSGTSAFVNPLDAVMASLTIPRV